MELFCIFKHFFDSVKERFCHPKILCIKYICVLKKNPKIFSAQQNFLTPTSSHTFTPHLPITSGSKEYMVSLDINMHTMHVNCARNTKTLLWTQKLVGTNLVIFSIFIKKYFFNLEGVVGPFNQTIFQKYPNLLWKVQFRI